MEQNTCSYEGPIEKLQTASFLIKQVLEETPEIYWQYARSNLGFPTIILRPPKHFKEQVETFRGKGVLLTGSGRTRDPDNEYNHAVDLAYSELLSIKCQLTLDKMFMGDPLPDLASKIDTLPPICGDNLKQLEDPLIQILDILIDTNPKLAAMLEKKARESLMGKTDSPSAAVIKAEIRAELKKAIRRFVKERDSLLTEQ